MYVCTSVETHCYYSNGSGVAFELPLIHMCVRVCACSHLQTLIMKRAENNYIRTPVLLLVTCTCISSRASQSGFCTALLSDLREEEASCSHSTYCTHRHTHICSKMHTYTYTHILLHLALPTGKQHSLAVRCCKEHPAYSCACTHIWHSTICMSLYWSGDTSMAMPYVWGAGNTLVHH